MTHQKEKHNAKVLPLEGLHLKCSKQYQYKDGRDEVVEEVPGVCSKPVGNGVDAAHDLNVLCLS